MKMIKRSPGFTLLELIIAMVMSAVTIFTIFTIVEYANRTLAESTAERSLQIDMNELTRYIMDGVSVPGMTTFGIRGARRCTVMSPTHIRLWDSFDNRVQFIADLPNDTVIINTLTSGGAVSNMMIYNARGRGGAADLNVNFTGAGRLFTIALSVTQAVPGRILSGSTVTSVYIRDSI